MSQVLWHALPVHANELSSRLRSLLESLNSEPARALRDRCQAEPHVRPNLVITGQYSSGKSTLINALTDKAAKAVVAVDVATDEVKEYDWDGVVRLVDTPGVKAGLQVHDQRAEEALAASDLVLFAITVELFDDTAAAHLRHVAFDLGKFDQLIVVVTKAGTLAAPAADIEQVRVDAVSAALRQSAVPPVVSCDARDYLDGLEHANPDRGRAYREASGIDDLRTKLNDLGRHRGALAVHRQPFQLVIALATEAESLLADDPREIAAFALLARQRRALSERRSRIDSQLKQSQDTFLRHVTRAAELFADQIEMADDVAASSEREAMVAGAQEDLSRKLDSAAAQLGYEIDALLPRQMDDLASEVREIEAGGYAHVILDLTTNDVEMQEVRVADRDIPGVRTGTVGKQSTRPAWAESVRGGLDKFTKAWGAGGGMRNSAGSNGHVWVRDLGKQVFGKKWAPWQAVRWADRIGKAARVGSYLLPVVEVVLEERARLARERSQRARRKDVVQNLIGMAQEMSHDALRQLGQDLDAAFNASYSEIDTAHRSIVEAQFERSGAQKELAEIQFAADHWLAEIDDAHQSESR